MTSSINAFHLDESDISFKGMSNRIIQKGNESTAKYLIQFLVVLRERSILLRLCLVKGRWQFLAFNYYISWLPFTLKDDCKGQPGPSDDLP